MLPEHLLRQILDNLTTAVVLLDGSLRVSYMNPAAEMLLEVSGQRVQGQRISSLFSDAVESMESLRNSISNGHPFTERDAQLNLSNGQCLMVDYSVTPVHASERNWLLLELLPRNRLLRLTNEEAQLFKQEVTRVLLRALAPAIQNPLSDIRGPAQQLAQLSKQEVTRVLVRGLAHEIKNPLGGIRGAAQLLARELVEPSLQDYTDVIIQEADRLRNLVDRMLGPYQPPRLAPINIHEITEHVCSLIQAETQGNMDILRDYDPSIPDLLGDREQLIQAVLNIVRNAMQAIMA